MRTLLTFAVTAMTLFPGLLLAQSGDEAVQAALDRAEAAGIPTSLLQSKLQEGTAKGVPMDRIAQALERRLEGLLQAREAISRGRGGEEPAPEELAVGADALHHGVSSAVLEQIGSAAGPARGAVAIAALMQLQDMGYAAEEAAAQVVDALSRGGEALANLPAQARQGAPGAPGWLGVPAGPPAAIPAPGSTPAGRRPGKPSGTGN